MMKKQQKGFTLIELMIVVAIIGILASVAIPMYGDYVTRSRLSTVLAGISNIKTAVTLSEQEGNVRNGNLVAGAGAAGDWTTIGMSEAPALPDGVNRIIVTPAGAIQIRMDSTILGDRENNRTITLTPTFGANATWVATFNLRPNQGNTALIKSYLVKYANMAP